MSQQSQTSQKRKIDPEFLKLSAQLQGEVRESIARTVRSFKANHPKAKGITLKSEVYAYKKQAKGASLISPALIQHLIKEENLDKTQQALIDEIASNFPEHNISKNVWSKKLWPVEIQAIEKILITSRFKDLNIKKAKKLSDVRNKIVAASILEKADFEFLGRIVMSKEGVLVGKNRYAIEMHKSGKYKYARIRVALPDGRRSFIQVSLLKTLLS